jgi:hypothetical protein
VLVASPSVESALSSALAAPVSAGAPELALGATSSEEPVPAETPLAAEVLSSAPDAPIVTGVVGVTVVELGSVVPLGTAAVAPGIVAVGVVEPVLAGVTAVVVSVAEVVARGSVEAAGPGLVVEHEAAATAATNSGRLEDKRNTTRPVTTA